MDDLPAFDTPVYSEKKKKRPPAPRRWMRWLSATLGLLALLLLAFFVTRPAPLSDVTGLWQGTLSQEPGGIVATYGYSVSFTQQDDYISGITRIWLPDDPAQYGLMHFTGSFKNGIVHFTESHVMQQNLDPAWRWCLKTADLYVHENSLSGTWTAPDCAPGRIELTQPTGDPASAIE